MITTRSVPHIGEEHASSPPETPHSPLKLLAFIRFRAAILLLFVGFLLSGPVPHSSDIIAAVLAYSLLALSLLLCLGTVVFGTVTRKRLNLKYITQHQTGNFSRYAVSHLPLRSLIQISRASIPPFFALSLKVTFRHPTLRTLTHILLGSSHSPRSIEETLFFPHRGKWQISSIHLALEDQFGLFSFQWSLPNTGLFQDILISPGEHEQTKAPLMSSSFRAGDESPHTDQRQGEPFDLKPYHPSDGMRKILWKVYAKTGELIARHPEQSMTPEGKSFVYVHAHREQDNICAHALAYLKLLEEARIDFTVGCLGTGERELAHSKAEAEDLFLDTAWDTDHAEGVEDLNKLIDSASRFSQNSLQQIILFLDPHTNFPDFLDSVKALGSFLESKNITPVFIAPEEHHQTLRRETSSSLNSTIHALLFSDESESRPQDRLLQHQALVQNCAQHSWQLILV